MNNYSAPNMGTTSESAKLAAERTKVVTSIIEKILGSRNIEQIFQLTTQKMRQALECDRLIIYQFKYDWSGQVVAESVGNGWVSFLVDSKNYAVMGNAHINQDRCLLRDWSQGEQADIIQQDSFLQETAGGKYARGQKFSAVDNIYTKGFPDCYINALETYQAQAYIIVPVFQDNQLWGLLGAYQNSTTRTWLKPEIEFMQQIATQLAIALQQTEYINQLKLQTRNLEITVKELKLAQKHLIQQEKLAALGQLVAGVAHEINTPLGAIQASAGNNTKALLAALTELPKLSAELTQPEQNTFFELIQTAVQSKPIFSSSEKRPLKKDLTNQLKSHQVDRARNIADLMIDIGITKNIEPYLTLLQHPQVNWILDLAYNLTRLLGNNRTILTSVEKASKVVFALKNYARFDTSGTKQTANIEDGLETVLEIYHNQLKQNIEVIRNYGQVPTILCYPDELVQVWTNLIHNGIQAMKEGGTLTLKTSLVTDGILIEIADSGSGIAPEIKDQIFEAFFTTKATGEGSGLGLHISKKIIDKHEGTINVSSEPGATKFQIWLPLKIPE